MKVELAIDPADLRAASEKITRDYLGAGKDAIAETTKWLERELEEITREAVPGRLWRAWKSRVFPKEGQIAREPAGEVFINGGNRSIGAMTFFTESGRIKNKAGGKTWLAIPTPAAGSRGRGRNLTPTDWERDNGKKLRFVWRGRGRSALLVADMGTTNGRTGTFRPITRARTKADERRGFVRGEQSVIIFVLVPSVAFANRLSIQGPIAQAGERLSRNFERRVSRIGG